MSLHLNVPFKKYKPKNIQSKKLNHSKKQFSNFILFKKNEKTKKIFVKKKEQ